MARYRKKSPTVDAVQITKENWPGNNAHPDWPDWLKEAWNKGPSDQGSRFKHADFVAGSLYLYTRGAQNGAHVDIGDWIIRWPGHGYDPLEVLSNETFQGMYEPVSE